MALRLLPFRQYDEQDVINLFKFGGDLGGGAPDNTKADSGMLVKVSDSDLSKDPIEYLGSSPLLGSSGYPHVARNGMPQVPLTCEAAGAESGHGPCWQHRTELTGCPCRTSHPDTERCGRNIFGAEDCIHSCATCQHAPGKKIVKRKSKSKSSLNSKTSLESWT